MKSKSPAFQFYPQDFVSDINVRLMSLAQRGAYITLLCHDWLEGGLPNDIIKLAKLCDIKVSVMKKLWPSIEKCFVKCELDPTLISHPRLNKEKNKQNEFRNERQKSGKKGASSRWNNNLTKNTSSVANGSAIILPLAKNGSSSISSSSDIDIDTNVSISNSAVLFELLLNNKKCYPIHEQQIIEWLALYPAVDIAQEIRKMIGWLDANPSKRKTSRGVLGFIHRWLSKAQDAAGKVVQLHMEGTNEKRNGNYESAFSKARRESLEHSAQRENKERDIIDING